jgi:RIO kinase 1
MTTVLDLNDDLVEDDFDKPTGQVSDGDDDELEFVGGRLVPTRVRYHSPSKHKPKSNKHHLETGLTMRSGAVYFDQHKAKRNERIEESKKISNERPEASPTVFNPSLNAKKHEREWIQSSLGGFFQDSVIADVLHVVRGGKEATVYCCLAHPAFAAQTGARLIAAKVYRPRMFRQLRNDAVYRQGRKLIGEDGKEIQDDREIGAVNKGTSWGKDVAHGSWLQHEFRTLQMLHQAGAIVPKPHACADNAILMEYMGHDGDPAPTLNHVRLDKREAQPLFELLMRNVRLMLSCNVVHGDLSAYNVLYWQGAIKIIDFPQVVNPFENAKSWLIFSRDVERLCEYFARYGIRADARQLAGEMWAEHVPSWWEVQS